MSRLSSRVLVDLPNWLGDFCHTLPALARLLEGNGRGETWVLLPPAHAPLARLVGLRVVIRHGKEGFWWARRRIAGRFDVALSARHSTRAKLLLAGGGAPIRLSSEGRGAAQLGLTTFTVDRRLHQRHDLDGALTRLGLAPVDDAPFGLALPAGDRLLGEQRRLLLGGKHDTVALLPSSHARAEKRYPALHFSAVGAALTAGGTAILVIVGPGEEALGEAVAAGAGGRLVPTDWPLDEVATILASCQAAVGNDSGLTHLASVVGCPTVALFGPTDPARTSPVGRAMVMRARGADGEHRLSSLAPADIARAVADLLAAQERSEPSLTMPRSCNFA